MAVKKYGAKKDANHAEIVAALRKCGVGVFDASDIGRGFPDLICGHRQLTHLVEIKNEKTPYGRAGLNEKQKKWARKWTGGPVYVIKNIQDVKSFAEGRFDELYAYGGYYNENVTDREIVRD